MSLAKTNRYVDITVFFCVDERVSATLGEDVIDNRRVNSLDIQIAGRVFSLKGDSTHS